MTAPSAALSQRLKIRVEGQRLKFDLSPRNPVEGEDVRADSVEVSLDRLQEISQHLQHTLDKIQMEGGHSGGVDELLMASTDFFHAAWPESIRHRLLEIESGGMLLDLEPSLLAVPWELAHDGRDFLGCRFAIGREIEGWIEKRGRPSRDSDATIRTLLLANPTGDLPASAREGEFLEKILSVHDGAAADLIAGRIDRRAFLESLSVCDVLHYSGHFDSTEGTSAWRLVDGPLPASEIVSDRCEGKPVPSLFFNNACRTEWMAGGVEASASWVHPKNPTRREPPLRPGGASPAEVLMRAGCLHYIGVLAKLPDEPARKLARIFYQHLLIGESVGRALLRAKLEVRTESTPDDLTWAQHLLYGDPDTGVHGEARVAAEVKTILEARFESPTFRGSRTLRELLAETASGFPGLEAVDADLEEGAEFLFDRPSEAVRFAITIANRASTPPEETTSSGGLRLAVHLGEMSIERFEGRGGVRSVRGLAADEAKRLVDIAREGQILLSRPVFDNARAIFVGNEIQDIEEIEWLDHGPYVFKGWDSPIEVCEVGEKGKAPLAPPSDTKSAYRKISPDQEPVLGWRPALGQTIPTSSNWKLTEKLGEGGFGEVWRAADSKGETRVFKFCFHADRVRALKREVTLFRILRRHLGAHPDIVQIYGLFLEEPPFYIEMEDVRGMDLAKWSARYFGDQRVDEDVRLEIIAKAADALQAAHDAGVIHRDVKPSNILIEGTPDSGEDLKVKLTDFGVGRLESKQNLMDVTALGFSETFRATEMSSGSGSRIYMAPELLVGKESSIRSDVYSLGMVLYQILVKNCERPLTVDWERSVRDPILLEDLRGCLSGEVSERFSSAGELAQRLRAVGERRKALETERHRQRSEARRKRVSRGLAAVAGLSLVVAGALGYGLRQAWIERENLERSLYHSAIQAAERAIQEPNPVRARKILYQDCPERFRGFEWGWLVQKCNTDHRSFAQDKPIVAMDLTPDNRFLVTGDEEGNLRIWDFSEGTSVRDIRAGPGEIRSMVLDTDSKWAAVSIDGRVRVWTLANGDEVPVPDLGPVECDALRFVPDRPLLAAAALEPAPSLALIDLGEGRLRSVATPHSDAIDDFVVLPEGLRAVTGGKDSLCCLIDLESGEILAASHLEGGAISAVEYDPTTGALATLAGRMLHIGDVNPFDPSQFLQPMVSSGGGLAFGPEGRLLGLNFRNHNVHVFDMGFKSTKHQVGGGSGGRRSVLFTADGEYFLTLDDDGRVRQRSLRTLDSYSIELKGHEAWVHCIEFSPDGNHVATGSEDATVGVWNAITGESEQTFVTYAKVTTLRYSPDGGRLVAGTSLGEVFVWNPHTGEELERLRAHPEAVVSVDVHPGGGQLATKGEDGEIRIWSTPTGETPILSLQTAPEGLVAYSPDGKTLLSNGDSSSLRAWVVGTWEESPPFVGHTHPVRTLDFFPSQDRLATGDVEGEVIIWDWHTRERIASFRSQVSMSHELIVTPDARRILTSVEIWDLGNLRPILRIPVSSKSLSPDGLHLAVGGAPHTARIEGAFPYAESDVSRPPGMSFEEVLEIYKRGYWKDRDIRRSETARFHANQEAPVRGVTGSWDFERRDLNAAVGRPLGVFGRTSQMGFPIHHFGTARAFGLPTLDGKDCGVVYFTGYSKESGFRVYSNAVNQEHELVHNYSMLLDIFYPQESALLQRAIYNSDPSNSTPAELVVSCTGGLGVDGVYHGEVTTGEWHRIAFTVKIDGTPQLAKYIDGRHVGTQTLSEGEGGRWALQEGLRGRYFLLLSGRDCDNAPCYLNNFQFRDYIMTDKEVAQLGGPSPEPFPINLSETTAAKGRISAP